VAQALAETQVPYEFVRVDMGADEHKMPELLAMHPFGQVSVVMPDGFALYENRAICRYITEVRRPGQYASPAQIVRERITFEHAAAVEAVGFHPAVLKYCGRHSGKCNHRSLPLDQVSLDIAVAELSAKLDVYEVILETYKFLAGDEFTLADLCH
ncbi:hypothetical protein DFH08DRAFT_699355, partial [Mycena albidolilacea]